MAGMRKFFGGVISGGLVAGLTLVVVSQVSQPRVIPADIAGADTASGGVTVTRPADRLPPVVVDADEAVRSAGVGTVSDGLAAPAVGATLPTVPDVASASALAEPDTGRSAASLVAPDTARTVATQVEPALTDAAAPEVAAVSEVAPLPAVAQPNAPGPSATPPAAPLIEVPAQFLPTASDDPPATAPGQPDGLIVPLPGPLALPLADGAPDGAELPPPPPLTPEEAAGLDDPARLLLPAPDPAPDRTSGEVTAADESAADPIVVPPVPAEPATPDPTLPVSPVIDVPEPPPAPEPPPVIVAEATPPPPTDQFPSILATEAAPAVLTPDDGIIALAPSTLPATPRLITAGEGALTDRDAADAVPDQFPPGSESSALPEVALNDGPATGGLATAFINEDNKPLFGILLIDSGDPTLDRLAAAALPFPVSIVIDPLSPDAAAHAALYRAGGKEVVMLATGIPEGATPADVEQTFQAHAAALPEAVAVVDATVAAFQNNRLLSAQIVPILAAQGRGLLTWDRGLNAADQVARREGLPTATIFRQIDADGESIPVMRRYLDRAAFKAAQEGHAVVIGTLRAETVAALLEWTIEGRASTVALAPASALLRTD